MAKTQRAGLDRYDVAILSALEANTRLTTVELAQRVHLSRTAVSRRISALRRMDVLKESADITNYQSVGFGIRAIVELAAPSHHVSILKDELLRQPEVLSVDVLAGEGLLCMDVIAFDMGHLHEFVHALQNRGDTTTRIFFAQEKSRMTLRERMGALNGRRPNGIANT